MHRFENQKGFTLVEMLVTLSILGLLASLAAPSIQLVVKREKERELKSSLMEIREAIDKYKKAVDEGRIEIKADESGYPPDLKSLYYGIVDKTDPNKKKKIFFLRKIPKDPFFPSDGNLGEYSWGLRSYESSYESPRPGKDVYDIYSLSNERAIDGSYYRNW